MSADFSRRNYGRARLLPSQKRQRLATGDWRLVERQRMANGFFWRAVLLHCREISALSNRTTKLSTERHTLHFAHRTNWAHREVRPPILHPCTPALLHTCTHIGLSQWHGRFQDTRPQIEPIFAKWSANGKVGNICQRGKLNKVVVEVAGRCPCL